MRRDQGVVDPMGFKCGTIKGSTLILLGAFALPFVIGDYVTTAWIINNEAGIYREANPFVASLYIDYGYDGLLVAKIATFLMIGAAAYLIDMRFCRRLDRLKEWAILVLVGFYMLVVLNNTLVIFTLGKI
jgi:hypothetical protein